LYGKTGLLRHMHVASAGDNNGNLVALGLTHHVETSSGQLKAWNPVSKHSQQAKSKKARQL
jgi:hypothetical protein